jgi:hypothetical protein
MSAFGGTFSGKMEVPYRGNPDVMKTFADHSSEAGTIPALYP